VFRKDKLIIQNIRWEILGTGWLPYHESSYTQKDNIINSNITAVKACYRPAQGLRAPGV